MSDEEFDGSRRASRPGHRALEQRVERLAYGAPEDLDVEAALRKVHARMDERAVAGVAPIRRGRREWSAWRRPAIRAAAALVVVLGAGVLYRRYAVDGAPRAEGVATASSFTTAVGARDSIFLPDGTFVLLGPASHLELIAGYGAGGREVKLRGVALFEVRHDAAHPFSVHAGEARIQDIGTRFTVRDGGSEGVRVVVTAGSVRLHSARATADSGVVLAAGSAGVVRPEHRAEAMNGADTLAALAWTQGRLVLDDASLVRMAAELRRWYGVELRIADSSLASRHVTASFSGEPAAEVLRVIALTLGTEVRMRGDTAVFGAPSPDPR